MPCGRRLWTRSQKCHNLWYTRGGLTLGCFPSLLSPNALGAVTTHAPQLTDNILCSTVCCLGVSGMCHERLFSLKGAEFPAFQEKLHFLHSSSPPSLRPARVISQHVYRLHRPGELLPKVSAVLVHCACWNTLLRRCWSQTGKWTRFSLTQVLNSTAFFKSQEVSWMKLIQMRNESDLTSSIV